jgi:hypothetical protein
MAVLEGLPIYVSFWWHCTGRVGDLLVKVECNRHHRFTDASPQGVVMMAAC